MIAVASREEGDSRIVLELASRVGRGCCLLLLLASCLGVSGCGSRTGLAPPDAASCIPSSDDEICDGIDNDCNGLIDDGIAPVICGELDCITTVECIDGVMPPCIPRTPSPEVCNEVDDDCDGEIDEGLDFGPVGEPILLRSDEFDTGDCTTCAWTLDPTLAPTTEGYLAFWSLGVSGGSERPSLYGRAVNEAVQPRGEIYLLSDMILLEMAPMPFLAPLPETGFPMEAIFRLETHDQRGFLFISRSGEPYVVRDSPIDSRQRNLLTSVWTGERIVSAWSSGTLNVASLAEDGSELETIDVDSPDGIHDVVLGVYPGRVAVLAARRQREPEEVSDLWLVLLDPSGELVQSARRLDVTHTRSQDIVDIVGVEEGWLLIRVGDSLGDLAIRQTLSVEGDSLSEPSHFVDELSLTRRRWRNSFLSRPESNHVVFVGQSPTGGDMSVQVLESNGDPLRSWSGPLPLGPEGVDGTLSRPRLTLDGGHILVIWHGEAVNDMPNSVYTRRFGCLP